MLASYCGGGGGGVILMLAHMYMYVHILCTCVCTKCGGRGSCGGRRGKDHMILTVVMLASSDGVRFQSHLTRGERTERIMSSMASASCGWKGEGVKMGARGDMSEGIDRGSAGGSYPDQAAEYRDEDLE